MSIIEFYHEAPLLATLITLGYIAVFGVFIYMMVRMYKK